MGSRGDGVVIWGGDIGVLGVEGWGSGVGHRGEGWGNRVGRRGEGVGIGSGA